MFRDRTTAQQNDGRGGSKVRGVGRRLRRGIVAGIVAAMCLGAILLDTDTRNTAFAGRKQGGLSDFSKVEDLVRWRFELRRDYSAGDILSRSNVEPVLKQLRLVGWTISDQKSILNRVPRDDAYLVRQLRTTAGMKFMRKVRNQPLVYNQLDRLTGLAHGRLVLQNMIKATDGQEMLQQLTRKTADENLDPSLARARKGANFDKPTGRIYTVDQLLAALKKSHERRYGKAATDASQ